MPRRCLPAFSLPLLLALMVPADPAFGQGGATSAISGTCVDSSGAVIPGADVTVTNVATGTRFTAVTADQGTFTVPVLPTGTYRVSIALMGFKTLVLDKVVLHAATPATVKAVLEVGGMEESVQVVAGADVLQTQSSTVSTTLDSNQISNLPLVSRNAIDFITFLPGVSTPGSNRNSIVNGLPQSTINITVDGMNVQDNYLKTTDGFFARMSPRLDAVEEVTVTTAANGADSSGQGATQIRFITRSGTNELRGSGYHYFRHHRLNSNTWFRNRDGLDKADLVQNQPGLRVGGPITIPGLWSGRNRAFYFVNYEELRQPTDVARNRIVLHSSAQSGIFRYNVGTGTQAQVREVNLFALAAANGQLSAADPIVARLLADIRSATGTTGSLTDLTDPLVQRYSFNVPQRSLNRYPTVRVDVNATDRHRVTTSYNYNHILSNPDTGNSRDPNFPGFPVTGVQDSDRYTTSNSLRSTVGTTLVNELRIGATGGATKFNPGLNAGMWSGNGVADQGGFALNLNGACCGTGVALTNAGSGPTPSSREASTKVIEDTLTWIKGTHSLSFGGGYTQADLWLRNQTLVPTINFGIVTGDAADGMFNMTNFPGASTANLTAARGLYSILVGRVSSMTANARLDESTSRYEFLGQGLQRGRMRDLGFFVQDSWRVRSNLTLNLGLRYELQLPFYPLNGSYSTATLGDAWGVSGFSDTCDPSAPTPATCNLFAPGRLEGQRPQFVQFGEGQAAFDTDWNNLAPSIGAAWTPNPGAGWLRALAGGESGTVIRAGWARSYNRPGMSDFSDVFGANPGVTITTDRTLALGNLGSLPLLFRERDRLTPPAFSETPVYPLTEVLTGDLNIFDPGLEVPYADTFSAGIQRALGKNMAVEARYVGTRFRDNWTAYNYNEINILENGFLSEFKLAQANLQANIAADRGATFRYFGPGTGTSPLPIFLAYFSGVPASQAGDQSRYTSTNFSNSTFVNPLATHNPLPVTAADALDADAARRAFALSAGLPANFLVANPDLLGGAFVTGNGGYTRYDSVQLELRRRFADGFQAQASYVAGIPYQSARYSFRRDRLPVADTGEEGGVPHAFKANWVYELPFGRDRRFGANVNGFVDRLIGGWQFAGTARIQSGRLLDFGNVRMVGFTKDELRDMFELSTEDGRLYMLPRDVIDNTVRAFSVSATSASGYGTLGPPSGRYFAPANGVDCIETAGAIGDCGVRTLVVEGPLYRRVDLSIAKKVSISRRISAEFHAEMLNAFNTPWFFGVTGAGSNPDAFEVTTGDSGRIVQLVSRVSW